MEEVNVNNDEVATICKYESEECDSTKKSTVRSFGGKMKSPFLGKTLPCGDDSDEEEDEDEVGNEIHSKLFCSESRYLSADGQDGEDVDEIGHETKSFGSERRCESDNSQDGPATTYEAENETEEELKAYEMRRYESKSERSSSSSEDGDEDSESPHNEGGGNTAKGGSGILNFVSGKQARSALGEDVHRPKPIMGGSPTQSIGGKVSSTHYDHDNDGDESSCASDSSSSESVESDSAKDILVDHNASSSDSNSSEDQASIEDNTDNCGIAVADDDSPREPIGDSSESEDGEAQVETEVGTSINEQIENISSPMEMELDGAIGGTRILSGKNHEKMDGSRNSGKISPRNSLSFEDVADIIKDHNSSYEDIGPDSKLCFSEDETDTKRLSSDVQELLEDALEIKRSNAGVLAAVRSLCHQLAQTSQGDQSGQMKFPESTCESFWLSELLPTLSPDAEAVKALVISSSSRSVFSEQVHSLFHSKLSSIDMSQIDIPSGGFISENTDPADSQVNQGRKQTMFLGSREAADCGLALAVFRISHVIRIECASPDNLDVIDGVKQSVHILPCDDWEPTSTSETVNNAADDISSALEKDPLGSRILVACATGDKYACAACVVFLMRHLGIGKANALEMVVSARPSATLEPGWLGFSPATATFPASNDCNHCPFSKRILSSQMLVGAHTLTDSPKRQKLQERVSNAGEKGGAEAAVPTMPSLDLGPSLPSLRRHSLVHAANEPMPDSSFECERYLSEELNNNCTQKAISSTPVPLSSSPLVVKLDGGETTVCEWPSNLAVDTVMAATMPLSPPPLSPPLCSHQEGGEWNAGPMNTPRAKRSMPTLVSPPN